MKIEVKDFNLEATLDSGQVFGFTKDPQRKIYKGIISGVVVELSQRRGAIYCAQDRGVMNHVPTTITPQTIRNYFDLDRDLNPVYEILKGDEKLSGAAINLKGLRLIHQDSWEALACFIISSNNNVKRIQGIWRNLCEYFCRGAVHRAQFPSATQIAKSHERILRQLGLGYRAPFLQKTAQFVSANPGSLQMIKDSSYEDAKARVLSFPGIGPKVADCVLLYGFRKFEAFPVDVWILRIMRRLYFKNRKISEDKIHAFGQKRWGKDAGYIQQYLFHGARTGILV